MTHPLLDRAQVGVVSARQALRDADAELRRGTTAGLWPTGFATLDGHLGGGLHAGDLALLAGPQGIGKTTMALQMARSVCAAGGDAVYVCFEHTPAQLVEKLLVMEAALAAGPAAASQEELSHRLTGGGTGLEDTVSGLPGATEALNALEEYGDRLLLVAARGDATGLDDVRGAAASAGRPALVVVDYLQKVHAGDVPDEDVRVGRIATALKDLALELSCPVLAVTAVDREGLDSRRIRARHLKGSITLAYEADVILVLQDKYNVVARHHLVYDVGAGQEHHRWLVCTVEKNRHGQDQVAVELRKRLSHGHFDPHARVVEEELVDERLHISES